MKKIGIVVQLLFVSYQFAVGQGTIYKYTKNSENIVFGRVLSMDTTINESVNFPLSRSIIASIKVDTELKGNLNSDSVEVFYYPAKGSHTYPPELGVDSFYLGFLKYNRQSGFFEPLYYKQFCFVPTSAKQLACYTPIIDYILDSTVMDPCKYFELLMPGIDANLDLFYRTLNDIKFESDSLRERFCIDESKIDLLFNIFKKTLNTSLLDFTFGHHQGELDNILLSQIRINLGNIAESRDLYAFEDKIQAYTCTSYLSFVKGNESVSASLDSLYDQIFGGTNERFIELTNQLILAGRR